MAAQQLYQPNPAPPDATPQELGEWAQSELAILYEQLTNFSVLQHNVLHVEPERPRDGMLVFADGTNWNPGSGRGIYVYDAAWVRLDTGGATTPGGANTQVQFNDGGSFGGDADFTWNKTTNLLSVTGSVSVADDLFFGAGSIISWDSGDITITHAPNSLTVAGGEFSALVTATGGNTQRTLANHFADTIHAKDYGVVADSATDDTAALQAAINATPYGGTLVLPPSGMKVIGSGSACLTIAQSIRIVGSSWGSIIFADSTVPNTRDIISVAPAGSDRGFFFSDFRIFNNSSARHGIHFQTANGAFVYNVHVDKLLIDATAGGNSIRHTGTGTGLGLGYSTIRRCNLESIKVTEVADGLTISENVIGGLGSNPGIYADCVAGAGLLVIDHNVITGTAGQIVLHKCYPYITDNYLEQFVNSTAANGAMLDIVGTGGTANQAKITNNIMAVVFGVTGVTNILRIDNAVDTIVDGNRFGLRGSNKHILTTSNALRTRIGPNNAYFTDDVVDELLLTDSGTNTTIDEVFSGNRTLTTKVSGAGLTVQNTSGDTQGAQLVLEAASASPDTFDTVGQVTFRGRDAGAAVQDYASVSGATVSVTAGSETGQLNFGAINAGAASAFSLSGGALFPQTTISLGNISFQWAGVHLTSGSALNWNNGDVTVTHSANALAFAGASNGYSFDADVTVPDEAYDASAWNGSLEVPTKNAIRDKIETIVSGGANTALSNLASVAINTALLPGTTNSIAVGSVSFSWTGFFLGSGGAVNWNSGAITLADNSGELQATLTGASKGLTVKNTDAGAGGTYLTLFADSASPAASDNLASVTFQGRNSGATPFGYSGVYSQIVSPTAAAESSLFNLFWYSAGTFKQVGFNGAAFRPTSDGSVAIGEAGSAWSSAFFSSGGVLNWNSSNYTITHSSGKLTFSGIGEFDGQLIGKGTATNDSAATGDIGEFVESEVLFGSAVTLTTATAADVTSISLTAGDWDVWGTVLFDSTNLTATVGWISTVSATFPTPPNKGAYAAFSGGGAGVTMDGPVGMRRVSISSTTTVYLGAYAVFPSGTTKAYGYIGARRAR